MPFFKYIYTEQKKKRHYSMYSFKYSKSILSIFRKKNDNKKCYKNLFLFY